MDECKPLGGGQRAVASGARAGSGRGLTLVHFSAQTKPFLSLKLYETTQCICKECSRQAEKWTSVSPEVMAALHQLRVERLTLAQRAVPACVVGAYTRPLWGSA